MRAFSVIALLGLVVAGTAQAALVQHDFTGTIYTGSGSLNWPNSTVSSGWGSNPATLGGAWSAGDTITGSIWTDPTVADSNASAGLGNYQHALVDWAFTVTDTVAGTLLTSTRSGQNDGSVSVTNNNFNGNWHEDQQQFTVHNLTAATTGNYRLTGFILTLWEITDAPNPPPLSDDDMLTPGADTSPFNWRRIGLEFRNMSTNGFVRVVASLDPLTLTGDVVTPPEPPPAVPAPGALVLLVLGAGVLTAGLKGGRG